jgi:enamine deaminase RidA (YjgF/YER057c/UK114 family)
MIERFPGLSPTRSRAVVHDDLVLTVAVAPDPVTPFMYEQTRKALARIDESLALCGTDKSRILSAIVYIHGMALKSEMNRAWDEWVDRANPPNAGLHRRRTGGAAYRRNRCDRGQMRSQIRNGEMRGAARDGVDALRWPSAFPAFSIIC